MNPSPQAHPAAGAPWTCPFCALLCDRFQVAVAEDGALRLRGSTCPRALAALSHFPSGATTRQPMVGGRPVPLDDALAAATALLAAARQPLIGGLATDVAGARALYGLADACHAILDHVNAEGLLPGLRTLQDRGLLQTTLAEIRNRCDLMVCIGTQPSAGYPEFFARCGLGSVDSRLGEVVFVGAPVDPALAGNAGVLAREVVWLDDAYTSLAVLNALCASRRVEAPASLRELAQRMLAARYVVFVWEPARLPGGQTALLVESINQLAKTVNRTTRAAGLALAGNDGGLAANQAIGWLSGLPLRTGVHAGGLQHEPHRYGTARLLAQGAVDALLWVASFGPDHEPPATAVPTIVLAHPSLAAAARSARVFVPVSTPGIGSRGHLFRVDGVVMVPLQAVLDDGLPTVADVASRIAAGVRRAPDGGLR
jgi:formylmethanofuran dehydrogenase subunit B